MQRKVFSILQVRKSFDFRRTYSEIIDDDFRVLNLRPQQSLQRSKRQRKTNIGLAPRTEKMSETQDWTAVWPGPRSFHPASVPLSIRQGYNVKGAPPSKYANAELMKIPNFLHLTPLAIKKQCEALKQFCTPWPKELLNENEWEKFYPIEIITSDYCHGLPTIRNPLARIVTLKIKLGSLKLDSHSRDKILRIFGDHYNEKNDVITITSDRCPVRKQNYNFCVYILTASYFESYVVEPWEEYKTLKDMISYDFNQNKSKNVIDQIIFLIRENNPPIVPKITVELSTSIETVVNEFECEENYDIYKKEVKKLLGL